MVIAHIFLWLLVSNGMRLYLWRICFSTVCNRAKTNYNQKSSELWGGTYRKRSFNKSSPKDDWEGELTVCFNLSCFSRLIENSSAYPITNDLTHSNWEPHIGSHEQNETRQTDQMVDELGKGADSDHAKQTHYWAMQHWWMSEGYGRTRHLASYNGPTPGSV